MAYTIDVNSGGSMKKRSIINIGTSANTTGREGASAQSKFYELEPAVVIDITLDGTDYQKLGYIKVRPIYSFFDVPESLLPIAVPLDSNIKSFPLKNEIVIVVYYGERLYYTQRLNFFNSVNNNQVKDLSYVGNLSTVDKNNYKDVQSGNPNVTNKDETNTTKLGKYFLSNLKIKSLLPMEGDVIYEGRFGNSIRFGGTVKYGTTGVDKQFTKNWSFGEETGSPIMIIRNGQRDGVTEKDKTAMVEDINKDAASIYLSYDQSIEFTPATRNQKSYKGVAPSKYNGKQVIITSDRLIFNARNQEIFLFAKNSVGIATTGTFNVDTESDTIINSSKIYLGLDAKERLILGDTTRTWLSDLISTLKLLIDAIKQTSVLTGTGPSSPIGSSPQGSLYISPLNKLTTLEQQLDTLLSKQNYTL